MWRLRELAVGADFPFFVFPVPLRGISVFFYLSLQKLMYAAGRRLVAHPFVLL